LKSIQKFEFVQFILLEKNKKERENKKETETRKPKKPSGNQTRRKPPGNQTQRSFHNVPKNQNKTKRVNGPTRFKKLAKALFG
jgi:hypothetical protein